MGIRHVGEHAAWILASEFNSIDKLAQQAKEALSELCEIGPVVAQAIYEFFHNPANKKLIERLKNSGIKTMQAKKADKGRFSGKKFVLTGALSSFSRDEAEQLIRNEGGSVTSSVSETVDFVLAGENSGSKYDKAKKLNLKIINEEEFKKMTGKEKK